MKRYFFLLPLVTFVVSCSAEQAKTMGSNDQVRNSVAQVQQAIELFADSKISDARVFQGTLAGEGMSVQGLDRFVDPEKSIVVHLEGELEWPIPYDKDQAGGEVRGKYAVVVFDKETGRFTDIKMSREKF